jgi:hypothetical protein
LLTSAKDTTTANQKAALQDKRNVLQHRIAQWRQVQMLHMPGVSVLRAMSPEVGCDDGASAGEACPESACLWLPSGLSEDVHRSCCVDLLNKEVRLRKAQADDALHHVRRQVHVRMGLIHYKQVQIDGPGQQSNTRARNLISCLSEKLHRYVNHYERACKVVLATHPDSTWGLKYQCLTKDNICAPTINNRSLGSGRRELSWIWRVQQQDCRNMPGGDNGTSQEDIHESRL